MRGKGLVAEKGARLALRTAALLAAVLLVGETGERAAHAQGTTVIDPKKLEEAKRHFQLGINLLRDPEGEVVEGAYLEFKTAYALSRSPRVLGNLGYCAMRLERNSESVVAYKEYVRLVPNIDPAERAQIEQDLVTMTDGAATLTVRYTGTEPWTLIDERVPVKGSPVTNSYGPTTEPLTLLIHPGHHVLHLKAGAEEQGRWEVDAVGGATVTHGFDPKPKNEQAPVGADAKSDAEPASRTPQVVMMGAGGFLVVTGVVTGIAAFAKMKDIERQCPNNVCAGSSYHDQVSTAATLGTVTDTTLIAGGLVAAGGFVWWMLAGKKHESASPSVTAACLPTSCAFSVRGSF